MQIENDVLLRSVKDQLESHGLHGWQSGVRSAASTIFGKNKLQQSSVKGVRRTANDGPVLPSLDQKKLDLLFG